MGAQLKRMEVTDKGCYYHIAQKAAGLVDNDDNNYPLTKEDKAFGMEVLQNTAGRYLIEIISTAWMGNHFHLILYVPGTDNLPSSQFIADRYNNYYKSMENNFQYNEKNMPQIKPGDRKACRKTGMKMCDLGNFMRVFQRRFAGNFNKLHDYSGHLWCGRYKSTILESGPALEAAMMYVELNPVRNHIVESPDDYPYTTWGNYCATGKHLFQENFVKHLQQSCSVPGADAWTDEETFAYFGNEMKRIIAYESNASEDELLKCDKGRYKSFPIQFLKSTRNFTAGGIIGSREFIRETASRYYDPKKVEKKQMAKGPGPSGDQLFSFRKLQCRK